MLITIKDYESYTLTENEEEQVEVEDEDEEGNVVVRNEAVLRDKKVNYLREAITHLDANDLNYVSEPRYDEELLNMGRTQTNEFKTKTLYFPGWYFTAGVNGVALKFRYVLEQECLDNFKILLESLKKKAGDSQVIGPNISIS